MSSQVWPINFDRRCQWIKLIDELSKLTHKRCIIFSNSEKCKISGRTRTPSSDRDGRTTDQHGHSGISQRPHPIIIIMPTHPVSRIKFLKLRMILLRPSSTEKKIDRRQTNASPLPWSFHFCTPSNTLPVYKRRRRGGSKRHSEESINFNLRSMTV